VTEKRKEEAGLSPAPSKDGFDSKKMLRWRKQSKNGVVADSRAILSTIARGEYGE